MSWRFRKRVKVAPGVNLNFSKNGTSVTVGGKGASVNIGKKGIYGNVGIPGTGIYKREKISGSKKRNGPKERNQSIPQTGLFDVSPQQVDEVSTKEAIIGLVSVLVCFIGGIIIGVKTGNIVLACAIVVMPFAYIFISKITKS